MPNFQRLLDLNFWFSLRPSALGPKGAVFVLVFFCLMIFLGIVFSFLSIRKKGDPLISKLFKKLFNQFFAMGAIGLILVFLSYEQIFLLGSYLWYLLWLVGFFVWSGFSLRYLIKKIPQGREERERKKRLQKYF